MEAFKDIPAAAAMPNPAGPDEMLHGPGDNEVDADRASQDDIDALFSEPVASGTLLAGVGVIGRRSPGGCGRRACQQVSKAFELPSRCRIDQV